MAGKPRRSCSSSLNQNEDKTMTEKALKARRAYQQAWRDKNRERLRAYHKAWREKNKERVMQSEERYWERKAEELEP